MKRLLIMWMLCMSILCAGCSRGKNSENVESGELLPEVLRGETFIYDELEHNAGNLLYTLKFTETGYKLYNDNGVGIISEGNVEVSENHSLIFDNGEEIFAGTYTGNAFESPKVSIDYNEKYMILEPDTESGEYIYLDYLGIYEGNSEDRSVILILDRWLEFYLYTDEMLIRGTYEVYSDGRIRMTTLENEVIEGTVTDLKEISFTLYMEVDAMNAGDIAFERAAAQASYSAEHAMGAYTLSFYDADVFAIHGVDGYVKAMGTVKKDGDEGTADYFPRMITNEMEKDDKFDVPFAYSEDLIVFPDSTYLLPRSGNIDDETGYASYWSAGTQLEFIKNAEKTNETEIVYESQSKSPSSVPIVNIFDAETRLLNQTMPSVGTAKPLVLLVDFPDQKRPRFITAEAIENAIFDVANETSLSAYYYRESYGNLTIDGTVLDWYRAEKNRTEYMSDKEIMEEALNYYIREKGLNLSDYDADQNGILDSLYVLWAGNMDDADHTWSSAYRSTWVNPPKEWETKVDGYIFVPGSTVWSSVPPLVCNVNSLTHETGHLLGLNDYYSYDTSDRKEAEAYTGGALEGGMGGMDMMDANIGNQNAFSKWLLGWLDPKVIEYEEIENLDSEENVYTLRPSNEYGDAIFVKLKPSDSLCTELFVIEAISPTQNASEFTRLKAPVVRIIHVEASLNEDNLAGNWRAYGFKYENSYTSTKFISILEADGKDEVLNYLPSSSGSKISYDIEDYFVEGDVITPNSYPNTNGYDVYGNATVYNGLKICIESIAEDGTAVISLGYEEQQDVLAIESVEPEAAVVPYVEGQMIRMPAGTTQITFTFDEAIKSVSDDKLANIKVLSGNAVIGDYEVLLDGNCLKIVFEQPLGPDTDYTVIIPQGILASAEDENKTNNYNSIFGFVTGE